MATVLTERRVGEKVEGRGFCLPWDLSLHAVQKVLGSADSSETERQPGGWGYLAGTFVRAQGS